MKNGVVILSRGENKVVIPNRAESPVRNLLLFADEPE